MAYERFKTGISAWRRARPVRLFRSRSEDVCRSGRRYLGYIQRHSSARYFRAVWRLSLAGLNDLPLEASGLAGVM